MNSSQQKIQEAQYRFPYHHLPSFKSGQYRAGRFYPTGIVYLSFLNFVIARLREIEWENLIDIGCGDGRFLQEASAVFPGRRLEGCDYSERAIAFARGFNPGLKFYCDDIAICRPSGEYDVATLIEVMEHIPTENLRSFLDALAGMIRSEGYCIVTVPSNLRAVHKKHFQHFSPATLRDAFKGTGLTCQAMYFINDSRNPIYNLLSQCHTLLRMHPFASWIYRYYRKYCINSAPDRALRLCGVFQKNG